jgi:aspartyl-tRNA(Asn)/glutamyl-tRNA(Gln) amidotransferase subunit C
MPYTTDYFKQLALNLRFRLSDEEALAIQEEFETLISQMSLLESIPTEDVEPMVYPNETPNTFLREDQALHVLSFDESLSNAPQSKNGYFVTKKVVL